MPVRGRHQCFRPEPENRLGQPGGTNKELGDTRSCSGSFDMGMFKHKVSECSSSSKGSAFHTNTLSKNKGQEEEGAEIYFLDLTEVKTVPVGNQVVLWWHFTACENTGWNQKDRDGM